MSLSIYSSNSVGGLSQRQLSSTSTNVAQYKKYYSKKTRITHQRNTYSIKKITTTLSSTHDAHEQHFDFFVIKQLYLTSRTILTTQLTTRPVKLHIVNTHGEVSQLNALTIMTFTLISPSPHDQGFT